MDEAEEEALFARLRHGLEAMRRDAALAAGGEAPVPADPALMAAVARVEASLRTLASGLESLARRADGQDAAIEARIEATVARATAGLRAEIDRISARAAPPRPPARQAEVARRPARGRAVAIGVVALLIGGAAFLDMRRPPDTDWLARAVAARVAEWRAALSGIPLASPAAQPRPSSSGTDG